MQIERPWLRSVVFGIVLVGSLLAADTASANVANYDECVGTVSICNIDQDATGGDNVVKLAIVIDQRGTTGTQDATVDISISQTNTSGQNIIEGFVRIIQKLDGSDAAGVTQEQTASITADLQSRTDSGRIVVDIEPLIEQEATGTASGSSTVDQAQHHNIEMDIDPDLAAEEPPTLTCDGCDLDSASGDIDAHFNPTTIQKLSASTGSGDITQTQGDQFEGGINLSIETHSEAGITTVASTNEEQQTAFAETTGAIDRQQFGPNILQQLIGSDENDQSTGNLNTTQDCDDDGDCEQDNDQECDVETEGEGNCTLETSQSEEDANNFQSCSINAGEGQCTIKTPGGEQFSCGPNCQATCTSGGGEFEGGCSEGGTESFGSPGGEPVDLLGIITGVLSTGLSETRRLVVLA